MTSPNYKTWDKILEQERQEKLKSQEKYCMKKGLPIFVMIKCPYCFKDILDEFTMEECLTRHITSCPHCNQSFVE